MRDAAKEALEAYRGADRGAEGAASSSSARVDEERLAAALDEILAKLKSNQDLVPGLPGVGAVSGVTVTAKLDAEQWTLLGERLTQLEQASKEAAEEAAQYTGKAVGRMRAGVREDLMGVSETLANIATSAAMANIAAERARGRRAGAGERKGGAGRRG